MLQWCSKQVCESEHSITIAGCIQVLAPGTGTRNGESIISMSVSACRSAVRDFVRLCGCTATTSSELVRSRLKTSSCFSICHIRTRSHKVRKLVQGKPRSSCPSYLKLQSILVQFRRLLAQELPFLVHMALLLIQLALLKRQIFGRLLESHSIEVASDFASFGISSATRLPCADVVAVFGCQHQPDRLIYQRRLEQLVLLGDELVCLSELPLKHQDRFVAITLRALFEIRAHRSLELPEFALQHVHRLGDVLRQVLLRRHLERSWREVVERDARELAELLGLPIWCPPVIDWCAGVNGGMCVIENQRHSSGTYFARNSCAAFLYWEVSSSSCRCSVS